MACQRGRWLVHDQDLGVKSESFRDFDHLSLGHTEVGYGPLEIELNAQGIE